MRTSVADMAASSMRKPASAVPPPLNTPAPVVTTSAVVAASSIDVGSGQSAAVTAALAAQPSRFYCGTAQPDASVTEVLSLIDAAAHVVAANPGPSPQLRLAREVVRQQRMVIAATEMHVEYPEDAIVADGGAALRLTLHGLLAPPHGPRIVNAGGAPGNLQQRAAVTATVPWKARNGPWTAAAASGHCTAEADIASAVDAALALQPTEATVEYIDRALAQISAPLDGGAPHRSLQCLASLALLKWIGTNGAAVELPDDVALCRAARRLAAASPTRIAMSRVVISDGGRQGRRALSDESAFALLGEWAGCGHIGNWIAAARDAAAHGLLSPVTVEWGEPMALVSAPLAVTDPSKGFEQQLARLPSPAGASRGGRPGPDAGGQRMSVVRVDRDSLPTLAVLPHQFGPLVDRLRDRGIVSCCDLSADWGAPRGHDAADGPCSPAANFFGSQWAAGMAVAAGFDVIVLPPPTVPGASALWNAASRGADYLREHHGELLQPSCAWKASV